MSEGNKIPKPAREGLEAQLEKKTERELSFLEVFRCGPRHLTNSIHMHIGPT